MTKLIMLFFFLVQTHQVFFLPTFSYGFQTQDEITRSTTYIIEMDKSNKPAVFENHINWYDSSLKSVSDSANMLYAYNNVIHGFATSLTENEVKLLKQQPGVVSVIPQIRYDLHTTRTPQFLGLSNTAPFYYKGYGKKVMSDLVIGVLDTGVWPESPSYSDKGLGPIPKQWRGECEVGHNFNSSSCNKKLVGARFFYKGYEQEMGHPVDEKSESKSPRDDDGHGTHTSTTAAGSAVPGADFLGYASGTARGMALTARLATYKVCWFGGCFGADIIAAVDKAIEDGVHILSMSLGGGSPEYFEDNIAIAAFGATARGILVSISAGNNGPGRGSLSNVAPWMITVGAGTIDRDFPAYIRLGNGTTIRGVSALYNGKLKNYKQVPIVYHSNKNNLDDVFCLPGTLIPKDVSGKIVVCIRGENSRIEKSLVVKEAGGVGMIYTSDDDSYGDELVADPHFVPTVALSLEKGILVRDYIDSVANPMATIIQKGTELNVQPSPIVAAFSSRGPNSRTPEILKPDVLAPGVNILAAWTGAVGPSGLDQDKRRVNFAIKSGTSMACPHVSGVAAIVKSVHPKWSPAAIRSALMTTAYSTYKNGKTIQDVVTRTPATPFDYGAGHVNPEAALDPGLVYDIAAEDYVRFLCASNYTKKQIKTVTKRDFNCGKKKKYSVGDLNYPSFAVPLKSASDEDGGNSKSTTVTYTRTLTNVGGSPATYYVKVSKVDAVKVLVKPRRLTFRKSYEKLSYRVTFSTRPMPWLTNRFARLEWSDGKHVVGSPIAFTWL